MSAAAAKLASRLARDRAHDQIVSVRKRARLQQGPMELMGLRQGPRRGPMEVVGLRQGPMEVMELIYSYCKDTQVDWMRAYCGLAYWWERMYPAGGNNVNRLKTYFDEVQEKRALRNRSLGIAQGLTGGTRTDPLVID
jgi:hypothetical protein